MRPNFAISDGWNWRPNGSWNHACVPLAFEPTGVSTRISRPTVTRYATSEKSRSFR